MRRRLPKAILVVGLGAVVGVMVNCGGGNPLSQPASSASSGSLVLFGHDTPLCDVVSFRVTITGATLTPQGGGTPVSVLSSGKSVTVDFAELMDFSTILNFASVPTGIYSQLTLTLSNPQLTVLDATKNPPAPTPISTSLTASTVTVSIDPTLDVTGDESAGLELDFNLRKSVQLDTNGQVTGTVNPVFQARPTTESDEKSLEIEGLAGIVQSVTTTSSNASFTGSFTLLTEDGSTFTVNATSSTEFEDVSGLSGLAMGTFVEVDAFVDSKGNIVAKEVEAEEQEDASQQKSAFMGLITSVTRDAMGSATQFTLLVREEEPDESGTVPLKSTLMVNVLSSTQFKITAKGTNKGSLQFGSTTLGPGQEVVVHAQAQSGTTPPTVNANAIFLRLQSIVGNFSTLLGKGSDGKTGGFTLAPCASLFQGQGITVFTFKDTAFAGVSDLTGLTPQPTLIVKGLLFYEQQATTVNGIGVTPPAWVFEAKQVHQLNP